MNVNSGLPLVTFLRDLAENAKCHPVLYQCVSQIGQHLDKCLQAAAAKDGHEIHGFVVEETEEFTSNQNGDLKMAHKWEHFENWQADLL
eukprot:11146765-Karenia_brevis.AAC.1